MADEGVEPLTSNCAKCDYALVGLPSTGVCPECGTPYDDRFIILRGYATGAGATHANASPKSVPWLLAGMTLPFALQFYFIATLGGIRLIWVFASFLGVILISYVIFTLRRLRIDGPPMQLWLCREGFWLNDRTAWVGRGATAHVARWTFPLVFFGLGIFFFTQNAVVGVLLLFFVGAISFGMWKNAHHPDRSIVELELPAGDRQRFVRWVAVTESAFTPRAHGQVVIRLKKKSLSFWTPQPRYPEQQIVVAMSSQQARSFQDRVERWRDADRLAVEGGLQNAAIP